MIWFFPASGHYCVVRNDFTFRSPQLHWKKGFRLNTRKTRFMSAAQRQKITGLVVNRHPNIPRRDDDQLKAVLHNSVVRGAATQNRKSLPDFRAHLAGKVSYVASVNPAKAQRLKLLFDQIVWSS